MEIEPTHKGLAGLPANAVKSFANNALFFAKSVAGPTLGQVCIERPVSRNRKTGPVRSEGAAGVRIEFAVVRNGQGFTVAAWPGAPEFRMTTPL